jgi:hypothetical protein
MKKVKINAGICGFTTVVTAESEDGQIVTLDIKSGCENVMAMAKELNEQDELDAFSICLSKPFSGAVYEAARLCRHNACPVPCAVVKCIEAECSLALPKNVSIEFVD